MSLKKYMYIFSKDEQGNMAIIFALLLMPMLAVITLSFDFARASTAKIGLQSAAEMAVHKAASSFGKNFKQRQNIASEAYIAFILSRKKKGTVLEGREGREVIKDSHDYGLSQKDGYYIFTIDKIQKRTVSGLIGMGDIKLHVTARAKIPVPVSVRGLANRAGGIDGEIDREQLKRRQEEALRALRILMDNLRDKGYFR